MFRGKRYLDVGFVEAGRGCHFKCDFCAVTSVFGATQTRRPTGDILDELRRVRRDFGRKLIFFVDDNITSNLEQAKAFLRDLIPLKIRWVSQSSINAAHDPEFLDLLKRSGCAGVLIGFESVDPLNLASMNKRFNTMRGGFDVALANLRAAGIRVYGTFVFGYDFDRPDTFDRDRQPSPSGRASTSPRSTTSRRSPARRCTSDSSVRADCGTRTGGSTSGTATTRSRSRRSRCRPTSCAAGAWRPAATSTRGRASPGGR